MIFERTIELIGEEKLNILKQSTVLVLGIGGVGGHCAEGLVRAGIGNIIIVDMDKVEPSNINRQLVALQSTIDQPKVEVLEKRLLDINPDCNVVTYHTFFNFETKNDILKHHIDFICDCIDTVTYKIDVMKESMERNIPMISSMGMGNKMHPERLEIDLLENTSYDPIARVIRTKLRRLKLPTNIPVVYSQEQPTRIEKEKRTPSSISFVPSVGGLIMASYVVNQIIG